MKGDVTIERGSMWRTRAAPCGYRWVRWVSASVLLVSDDPDQGGEWMTMREFLRTHRRA